MTAYRSPNDEKVIASLWGEQYSDMKIARIMGTSHSSICRWRMKRGVPCNYGWYSPRLSQKEEKARISLWNKGYTDTEIARVVGCTSAAIHYWRKRKGIPSNNNKMKGPLSEEEEILRASLWGELLQDKEIAEKLGLSVGVINKWRRLKGIPRNTQTRLHLKTEDEIARISLWGEGYSDQEIAKILGRTTGAIYYWRRKRGIPKNLSLFE